MISFFKFLLFCNVLASCKGGICDNGDVRVIASEVTEPVRSCTDGFTFDDTIGCCFMDVVVPPLLNCLSTGGVLNGDVCTCTRLPIVRCPKTYMYNAATETCDKVDLTPMIPSCSHVEDGILSNDGRKCMWFKKAHHREVCPRGAKMVDGMCLVEKKIPEDAIPICPDGWVAVGDGVCEMLEEISCTETVKNQCKNKSFSKFKHCRGECKVLQQHNRHLHACERDDCVPIPADILCQATECQMRYSEETKKSESTGILSRGGGDVPMCNRTVHMKAKLECQLGVSRKGVCVVEESQAPIIQCPRGSKEEDGECFKEVHSLSEFVCPRGYKVNCSGKRVTKAHPAKCECISEVSVPARSECPVGSKVTNDGLCDVVFAADAYCPDEEFLLGHGGMCHGRQYEPARIEYRVTYTKEKECTGVVCKERVVEKDVQHSAIYNNGAGNRTRCDDEPCINVLGKLVGPKRKLEKSHRKKTKSSYKLPGRNGHNHRRHNVNEEKGSENAVLTGQESTPTLNPAASDDGLAVGDQEQIGKIVTGEL